MGVQRLHTDERGGILVLSAFMIALFLVLTALVVDVGNWYTHKRQLQNKADAGALAAGYEYLAKLKACKGSPVVTANAISDVAKQYAGEGYNQTINATSSLTVRINASSPTDADWTDGASPCVEHPTGDSYSPAKALWTDVKVRETNVGTIFGGFGLDLLSATAQARVELKQIVGVRRGGLPFINETGDFIDCVWAEFVLARAPGTRASLIGTSNPVLLTKDPSTLRRWTANVGGIDIDSSTEDIAVVYWAGVRTGATCNFSTQQKGKLPETPVDWINVYEDDSPGANQAPMLKHFTLTPSTCGPTRVGFIHSTAPCNIGFTAEVDSGPNPQPSTVIVESVGRNPPLVGITGTATGSGPFFSSSLTLDPTAVTVNPNVSEEYTQVGQHRFRVRWSQTAGRVGAQVCTSGTPCVGTFLSEQPLNAQHATYLADPMNSNPLFSAELLSGGAPLQNSWAAAGPDTGPFMIEFTSLGIDQDHTLMIRESVQSTGNRTFTVQCWPTGGGTPFLGDAIDNGCPVPVTVNQRNGSCSPAPPLANGNWDCVETLSGNHSGIRSYWGDRFDCSMNNNWIDGVSPANLLTDDEDKRFAYIFLTDFGRVANVNPNTWLPIRAFLRVYVTGWDAARNQDGWEECGTKNDPPPPGYDGNGSQLWGHFVDVVTLSDDVIVGDDVCNLDLAILNCKPALVR